MFSCQKQYLTRSLRSLVRYCFCHSNIKSISSRNRIISYIYLLRFWVSRTGISNKSRTGTVSQHTVNTDSFYFNDIKSSACGACGLARGTCTYFYKIQYSAFLFYVRILIILTVANFLVAYLPTIPRRGKIMSNQRLVKDVFLWSMSAIYMLAFASLYLQIPGES